MPEIACLIKILQLVQQHRHALGCQQRCGGKGHARAVHRGECRDDDEIQNRHVVVQRRRAGQSRLLCGGQCEGVQAQEQRGDDESVHEPVSRPGGGQIVHRHLLQPTSRLFAAVRAFRILYRFRRGYCIGFHGFALGGSAFGRRSQAPEEHAEPVQPLLRVQRGAEHSADDQGHHNQYRAGDFQLAVRQRKQRAQSAGKSCHAHDQPACQHDDFLIPRAQLPAEHDARVACHDHGQHVYDQSQYCHRKILLIPPVLRLPLL